MLGLEVSKQNSTFHSQLPQKVLSYNGLFEPPVRWVVPNLLNVLKFAVSLKLCTGMLDEVVLWSCFLTLFWSLVNSAVGIKSLHQSEW